MRLKDIIISISVLGITSMGIIGLMNKDVVKEDIITANMDNITILAAGETGADTKNIYVAYGPDTLEDESEWSQYGRYIEEDVYASYGSNVNIDDWKTSVSFKDLPQPKWGCHKFEGWFPFQAYNLANGGAVTSSADDEILSTTYVDISGDQRLYAHWSEWHPGTYYEKTATTHTLRCTACNEKVEETNLGGYRVIDEGKDGSFSTNPTQNHEYGTSSGYYKAPTCTNTGWEKCKTVSSKGTICGYVSTIPALGHDYDSSYTTDTAPWCTSSGWESRHCMRPGCSSTTGGRSIPSLGHDWYEYISEKCTSSATDKCDRCGSTTTGDGALGHNYVTETAATCTTSEVKGCTRCSSTTTGAGPTGHTLNSNRECTKCDYYEYSRCSCCSGNEYTCSCSSSTCSTCGDCINCCPYNGNHKPQEEDDDDGNAESTSCSHSDTTDNEEDTDTTCGICEERHVTCYIVHCNDCNNDIGERWSCGCSNI